MRRSRRRARTRRKTAPRVGTTLVLVAVRFTLPLLAMVALWAACDDGHVNRAALTNFPAVTCMSSATCVPGDVCCGTPITPGATEFVRCMPSPCPTSAPVQVCRDSAECVGPGFMCGSNLALPEGGSAMICTKPDEADASPDDAAHHENSD